MKNLYKIYIVGLLILLYSLFNYIYILKKFTLIKIELILMAFWILLCALVIILYGFPRKNVSNKSNAIKSIIVILLINLIISYLLGLVTGFSRNVLSKNIFLSFKLVVIVSIWLIAKEIIRYIIAQNSEYKKKPIIILTIAFIIFEVVLQYKSINTFEELFLFLSVTIIPTIVREIILSYISFNFGLAASLIYIIPFEIFQYIVPIIPNLGNYINSIINLIMPFLLYMSLVKIVKYNNKENLEYNSKLKYVILVPIFAFLVLVIVLVSGIFKYKLIAIGSNSMNPIFSRGDSVIYEQTKDISKLKEGDILVFKKKDYIITHRIVSINYKNNKVLIKTKGDNNEKTDSYYVYEDEVLGVIRSVVKYIGYPTVWISENIKGV